MVAIKMEGFGGAVPMLSRRLLADNMAELAVNADVLPGELRPIPAAIPVHTFSSGGPYARAYAIPDRSVAEDVFVWVGLRSVYGRVFRSPLVNDKFERFIKLDDNGPDSPSRMEVNSFARIKAGQPWLRLGMEPPSVQPSIEVVGGSGNVVTRSYAYTYVNIFGEESAPSAPTVVSGFANGAWQISSLATPFDVEFFGIEKFRIYRSITGNTGTDFFRVVEQAIINTTYSDTRFDSLVASEGLLLRSVSWLAPLEVEGVIALPNGVLSAWAGRDVFFSEPYRPWAWPAEYTLATMNPIVGCGVFGNSLVALTETTPTIFTGNNPRSMSVEQMGFVEPCESPGSIVSTPEGVYFAGRSGLFLVGPGSTSNVTRNIITVRDWKDNYLPDHKFTVVTPRRIMAFGDGGRGFSIDKEEARAGVILLRNAVNFVSVWQDELFSRTYGIFGNTVYELETGDPSFTAGGWRSKEFVFPKPMNYGALLLSAETRYVADNPPIYADLGDPVPGGPWTSRMPLFNYSQFNGGIINDAPVPGTLPPGGSPPDSGWPFWYGALPYAFSIRDVGAGLPAGVDTFVAVYADRQLIWSRAVTPEVQYRLPSGFKAEVWQFEIVTRVPVFSLIVGETGKDLGDV